MRQLSLFSGIEGFGLAGQWLGWQLVASVEIENWCQQVIKHNFPNTIIHGNIKKTSFKKYAGAIDIITGGFPCQSFSLAGKGAMDLSLWLQMLRAIREVKPGWVVAENVYGLVSRKRGVALEQVCAQMEDEGYTVFPPVILPACAVGAPHRRDRVWIIAYNNTFRNSARISNLQHQWQTNNKRNIIQHEFYGYGVDGFNTNTQSNRLQRRPQTGNATHRERENNSQKQPAGCDERIIRNAWQEFPTQQPVCNGNDGLPAGVDGIKFSKWNKKTIEAAGNAIVPQVFFEIGLAINEINKLLTPSQILND